MQTSNPQGRTYIISPRLHHRAHTMNDVSSNISPQRNSMQRKCTSQEPFTPTHNTSLDAEPISNLRRYRSATSPPTKFAFKSDALPAKTAITNEEKESSTLKLLTELEQSLPMFSDNWRVVDLFGGLQIWQESKAKDALQLTEPMHDMLASTSTAGFVAFLAGGIGGSGILGAFILAILAAVTVFWSLSAPRLRKTTDSYKTVRAIMGSPEDIFAHVLNLSHLSSWDASVDRSQVVHTIDDHTDIIHIVYRPTWMWPFWICSRDFCLLRYWRRLSDGSYVICMQSAIHPECPPQHNIVRAQCKSAGYIIAPSARAANLSLQKGLSEHDTIVAHLCTDDISLVTAVFHMDPQGWEGNLLHRCNAIFTYLRPQLLSLIGLQEAMEARNFVCPNLTEPTDALTDYGQANVNDCDAALGSDDSFSSAIEDELAMEPPVKFPSNVPPSMWGEADVGSMLVRGPCYLLDRRKIPSAPPAFSLVGVDLLHSDEPLEHFASHPDSGIQKEMQRHEREGSEMPFTFIINFIVPGNPRLSMILYYQPTSPHILDRGSSTFADLMLAFIEGTEEYRTERFKLIPCIVEGSFIVRQAVGTTPSIIGKKLRQPIFLGQKHCDSEQEPANNLPQYLELDVDIASSAVANRVVGLVAGYTKKLIIDLGFLIEAQEEDELPERLIGTCRLHHIDLSIARRI